MKELWVYGHVSQVAAAPSLQVNQCRAEVPQPPGTPPMFDFDHSVPQSVCLPERITDQVWRVHR